MLALKRARGLLGRLNDDDGDGIQPNALPNLSTLCIEAEAPPALVAGLLGAAGAQLTKIETKSYDRITEAAVLGLILEEDYPWLAGLHSLTLHRALTAETPTQIVAALTRLPALEALAVACLQYDELFVRLLVHAENGGASALPAFKLLPALNGWGHLSAGAHLLLLLWLKREAKKAVQGQGQGAGVKWEVQLGGVGKPYITEVTAKCLKQVKAAWARV